MGKAMFLLHMHLYLNEEYFNESWNNLIRFGGHFTVNCDPGSQNQS